MRRLHARDHPELFEARDILRRDDLCMFDAETRFSHAPFVRRDFRKSTGIEVENVAIGSVADGVDGKLHAGLQRPGYSRINGCVFVHQQTLCCGIAVGFQQGGTA